MDKLQLIEAAKKQIQENDKINEIIFDQLIESLQIKDETMVGNSPLKDYLFDYVYNDFDSQAIKDFLK